MLFIATGARFTEPIPGAGWPYSPLRRALLRGYGGLVRDDVRCPRVRTTLRGEDVKMKPRDLQKAAPYLGVLLLAVVVFIVVRSLL